MASIEAKDSFTCPITLSLQTYCCYFWSSVHIGWPAGLPVNSKCRDSFFPPLLFLSSWESLVIYSTAATRASVVCCCCCRRRSTPMRSRKNRLCVCVSFFAGWLGLRGRGRSRERERDPLLSFDSSQAPHGEIIIKAPSSYWLRPLNQPPSPPPAN